MATHDYVLANQSGSSFRTDLNNALAAVVSNNSNATEPSTKYAYELWADTNSGYLKIRNAANNAWIQLFKLDGTDLANICRLTGSTNNTITTVTGANAIQGEANLQFDGTNLGVGTAPTGISSYHTVHIKGPSGEGAGIRLQDNGDTADSSDATIYKNATALYLRVNGTDPLIAYLNGAEKFKVESGGNATITNGSLVIGTHGKGIDFSANTNDGNDTSELLDEYEEGTFQANIKFGGGSANISHTDYAGRYTKIGRLVTCSFVISLSSKGTSTGDATINALPFTSTSDSQDRMWGLVTHFSPMTNVTSQIVLYMTTGESKIGLYDCSTTGVTAITDSNFSDNTMIRGFIQYHSV